MTSDTPFVHLTTPCGARFSYLTHLGEEARELDIDTLLRSVSLSVASPCCQRRVKYAEHASGELLSCVGCFKVYPGFFTPISWDDLVSVLLLHECPVSSDCAEYVTDVILDENFRGSW